MKYNPDLVYQVVRARLLNKRRPIASTKDRSEVSGGGKKPWPQKGTGRARHGSIRSPLWRKGGVTFGPRRERSYAKVVPEKIARKALSMVLEKKREDRELIEVDDITSSEGKTKAFSFWLSQLRPNGSSLVIPHKGGALVKRAGRNIPKVKVVEPENVDIIDLLSYKYLIITKEALARLEERTKIN
ncbi:MAG: 50S ribosomal protein L4 [Candidatus Portnoybacteria bacterium]|nr:50S ribosomal protein L4 [Candidatus Portnoybacteria bacterium]